MEVERDLYGFVIPFALGTVVSTCPNPVFNRHIYLFAAAILIVITAFIILQSRHRKHLCAARYHAFIITSGLLCGLFIGLNGSILSISDQDGQGLLDSEAERFATAMKEGIDNIPFDDPQTNGIIKALLTGDRENLSSETISAFRDSGASHILALSGFHLGIIYGVLCFLTGIFGNTRLAKEIRSAIIILTCGFYSIATGAAPSITRAFLFITLRETAQASRRYCSTGSLIASAALIQIAANPLCIYNIGFQLSYAAMAGIAFIYPALAKMWGDGWKGIHWIWNSAIMSISCQLTTGPIAYHYFKTFPRHFLLTNLIALPLTSGIILCALITLGLSSMGLEINLAIEATEHLVRLLTDALELISSM